MIKDILFAVFCIGVFLIGMVVAADVAVQVRHKLSGSPLAHKVFEDIIRAKDETIRSQAKTIQAQQDALKFNRKRVKELQEQLDQYETEEHTDGNL